MPRDLAPTIDIVDSTSAVPSSNRHGANRGAPIDFDFSVDEAGSYYLVVDYYSYLDILYDGTKADSYSKPYKFRID